MNTTLREVSFLDHSNPIFKEMFGIIERTLSEFPTIEKQYEFFKNNSFILCSSVQKIDANLKSYTEDKPLYLGVKYQPLKDGIFIITIMEKIDEDIELTLSYLFKKYKKLIITLLKFIEKRQNKIGDRFLLNAYISKNENPTDMTLDTLVITNVTPIPNLSAIKDSSGDSYIYAIYSSVGTAIKRKIPHLELDFIDFPYKINLCMEVATYKKTIIKIHINGYYCDNWQLMFNIICSYLLINDQEERIAYLFRTLESFTDNFFNKFFDYLNSVFFVITHGKRKDYYKKHGIIPKQFFTNIDPLSKYITDNFTSVSNYMTRYFEEQ